MRYTDLLKLPEWQKRRLGMLEAAGWVCKKCGAKSMQLHVHHLKYVAGRKPWEYSDDELIVLCEDCHDAEHDQETSAADVELEKQIDAAQKSLLAETDLQTKRATFVAMTMLIKQRSPQHIKQLEYRRGLR